MSRGLWLGLMLLGAMTCAEAEDIAAAAESPYKLAKYVDTHDDFDARALWKALNIKDQDIFLPGCQGDRRQPAQCSSELITVVDPLQVIVLLEDKYSEFQVYLRYRSTGARSWRFAGAYAPFVKYFHPEHRMTRLGLKPFLVVAGQGAAGTGVTSKVEDWFDLTRPAFQPVLRFTAEATSTPAPIGIARSIRSSVVSRTTQPVERITVVLTVEFAYVEGLDQRIPIGSRRDKIVYVRSGSGDFEMDRKLSTASAQEVRGFYENMEYEFSDEVLLKFNFKGLAEVAKGKDKRSIAWLTSFLERCPDSEEARKLKALLATGR
jgi:hypothetical protein